MTKEIISEPGTMYGPCDEDCQHATCAADRIIADGPCTICGEPIGYGREFFRGIGDFSLTHEECLE